MALLNLVETIKQILVSLKLETADFDGVLSLYGLSVLMHD